MEIHLSSFIFKVFNLHYGCGGSFCFPVSEQRCVFSGTSRRNGPRSVWLGPGHCSNKNKDACISNEGPLLPHTRGAQRLQPAATPHTSPRARIKDLRLDAGLSAGNSSSSSRRRRGSGGSLRSRLPNKPPPGQLANIPQTTQLFPPQLETKCPH